MFPVHHNILVPTIKISLTPRKNIPIAWVIFFFSFCLNTRYISHLFPNFLGMIYISLLKSHGNTGLHYSFALSCQRHQVTRNVHGLLRRNRLGEKDKYI